jgi:POT family proton-dependent oligopeptide transporter
MSEADWFGHPRGLFILFFTEMWERFSFYGMRALLVFYMTKHLLVPQQTASHIYGLYGGLVYFTPLLGGWLADRRLGRHCCVVWGGIFMAVGHFLMAFEALFYPALACLILGNGLFKPNISAQVGELYPAGDPRRDRAFSIFYVGINLGAFLAPLVCGFLGEVWGWHYGFGAAGVGMLAGLGVYLAGRPLLPRQLMGASAQARADGTAADARGRILGFLAVCLAVVVFWAVYEQLGNTMALWVDSDTDRTVLGWEMPASWFQSANPFLIFLLTPCLTALWARQGKRGREPSSPGKMAMGLFLAGAAFLVMVYPARLYAVDGTPVSMFWLLGFVALLTLAELHLSPVGLSLVTKIAPVTMVSMFMGVWFLAQFCGNLAAGLLGGLWGTLPHGAFFLMLAVIACVAGLCTAALVRPLARVLDGPRHPKVEARSGA